jgi:hypothetical protein
MNSSWDCGEKRRDDFAGKLADAALVVTARHDVRGSSVERELELWHSLGDVVRDTGCAPDREEILLAELTDAAYQVALAHGTGRSFLDLELELWRTLRRALAGRAPARADEVAV